MITSENGTFPPITATRDSAGHISAFFPNLNKTLEGQVLGNPSCDDFYWQERKATGSETVQMWLKGPLPPPSAPCKFSKSDNKTGLWHSQEHQAIKDKVFMFDSVDDSHFTIHSLNGTFNDTTATVVNPPSGNRKTVTVQFSDRQNMSHGILSECRFLEFLSDSGGFLGNWQQGPIPPPPPPPPAQCETSFNQTACDAVKHTATDSCVWCTSNDGDHSLCFHKSNEPDSGTWKCDGAAATRSF